MHTYNFSNFSMFNKIETNLITVEEIQQNKTTLKNNLIT